MTTNYSEEIYYRASSKGKVESFPLLLIHGAGGDHLHWGSEIRCMDGLDVYTLDLPGHGQSSGEGFQDVRSYCDAIVEFLDRMKLDKVFIAGHSMGGAIAQTMAVNYPERLDGLILVSTGMTLPVNPDLLAQMKDPTGKADAIKLVVKWSFRKDADPEMLQMAEEQLLSTKQEVIYSDYLACSKFDLSTEMASIDLPTLIICGDVDKMTPLKISSQIQETVEGSKLVVVPNAGHMVIIEQPQVVSEQIGDFIKNL
jgi:pimeloyl-ACP methyl ester carboxylesterase